MKCRWKFKCDLRNTWISFCDSRCCDNMCSMKEQCSANTKVHKTKFGYILAHSELKVLNSPKVWKIGLVILLYDTLFKRIYILAYQDLINTEKYGLVFLSFENSKWSQSLATIFYIKDCKNLKKMGGARSNSSEKLRCLFLSWASLLGNL